MDAIVELVNEQAEDDGLWFVAATAPEAYLQQELRRLHELIERIAAVEQGGATSTGRKALDDQP